MTSIGSSAPAPQGRKTELTYVGSRPYIRGADLLMTFLQNADQRPERLVLLRLLRELQCNGHWQPGGIQGASATIDFRSAAGNTERASFVEDGERITVRVPDIPSRLVGIESTGDFAGTARVAAVSGTKEFLDALIEADKRLHQKTLEQRGLDTGNIRFVYLENFPLTPLVSATETDMTIKLMAERTRNGQHFTIVSVASPLLPEPARLCYSSLK